jgi:hypothetical protein
MIKSFLLVGFLSLTLLLGAQTKVPGFYAVYFADKANNPYSISQPQQFMSQRALDRYQNFGIAFRLEDLPVTPAYLDSMNQTGATVYHPSRWLNAAMVICTDSLQVAEISQMSIVQSLQYLGPYDTLNQKAHPKTEAPENEIEKTYFNTFKDSYGESYHQLNMLGIPYLHSMGYHGEGIHIAVLDAGFWRMDQSQAYDSLRAQNGLLSVRDLVSKGNNVYNESSHGTNVLSTMAAHLPGQYKGSAIKASYHLFRTENTSEEYPTEEFLWLVGAELADSLGADIITSSLSYHTYDDSTLSYQHSQLDGNTAIVSKAASIADKKGILVLTSAGNGAQGAWQKIGFPSDAADILTIGAVDSAGLYAPFSSVGYTADNRVKPDLSAMGQKTFLVNSNDQIFRANGTSFSTPIVAGGAALLMQANPLATPFEIRQALIQSASQAMGPDSLVGYGIPNFILADMILKHLEIPIIDEKQTFKVVPNPFSYQLSIIYEATDTQYIDIEVCDITGKKVWEQQNVFQQSGANIIKLWNLESLQDGVYFIKIRTNTSSYSQKIIKHK